jgi:K+-sensing histidine kinase KdpD
MTARTYLWEPAQAGQLAVRSDLGSGHGGGAWELRRPVIALRSGVRLTIPIPTDGTRSRAEAAGIPAEFDLARATFFVVAATVIASVVLSPAEVTNRLIVIAAAVCAITAATRHLWVGLAIAVLGMLLFNGFLLNRYAELRWDADGWWHAAVVATATGLGIAAGRVGRRRAAAADSPQSEKFKN